MIEQPVHRGRVVLIGTSAEPSWTAMPLWPSFVPLVRKSWPGVSPDNSGSGTSWSASRFDALVASSAGTAPPKVQTPDGRCAPATLQTDGDGACPDLRRHLAERHLHGQVRSADQSQPDRSPSTSTRPKAISPRSTQTICATKSGRTFRSSTRRPGKTSAPPPSSGTSLGKSRLHVDLLYVVLGLLLARNVPRMAADGKA